jgi:phosphomethylpyrimidine synthase
MFPEIARAIREKREPAEKKTCTMCGDFCAMKKGMEVFHKDIAGDKVSV